MTKDRGKRSLLDHGWGEVVPSAKHQGGRPASCPVWLLCMEQELPRVRSKLGAQIAGEGARDE